MKYTEYGSIRQLCDALARQHGLSREQVVIREDSTVPKLGHRPSERQTGRIMVSNDSHTIVRFIIEELRAHKPVKYRAWVYDDQNHVSI